MGWDGFPILTSNRHKTEPPASQRRRKRGKRGNTQRVGALPAPPVPRRSQGGICRLQPAGGLAQTVGWGLGVMCTHIPTLPQRGIPYKHRCCHLRHSPCSHGRREDARPPRQRPARIFFPVLSRHARFLLLFNFLLLLHPRQDPSEARSLFPTEFLPAVGFGKHPLPPPCSPRAASGSRHGAHSAPCSRLSPE